MKKKIRTISISDNIDKQLMEDSNYRGLTISANVSRILFDYFINNSRKRKRKLLWENEKVDVDVSLIKEYFKTSLSKAKYIYKLMSSDDMGVIRKRLFKGGLKK